MRVYLNGEYLEQARAAVSVDDRGFLFGDGVYEVTRARNGRLFEAGRHPPRPGAGPPAGDSARPAGGGAGGGGGGRGRDARRARCARTTAAAAAPTTPPTTPPPP